MFQNVIGVPFKFKLLPLLLRGRVHPQRHGSRRGGGAAQASGGVQATGHHHRGRESVERRHRVRSLPDILKAGANHGGGG